MQVFFMNRKTKYHKVTFLPERKYVMVENLKSVFETILENNPENIQLNFACGAEGICQKCKIRSFQRMGPLTPTEKGCLSAEELSRGIRLACQARVIQTTEAEIIYKEPFTIFHVNNRLKIKDVNPKILKKLRCAGINRKSEADCSKTEGECCTEVYFENELINVEEGDTRDKLFAAAVDVGINTVTISLVDINSVTEIARVVDTNPTLNMGGSFEQRTEEVAEDRLFLELLCEELVLRTDVLLEELCRAGGVPPEYIYEIIVCGSTGMMHLFFERACHCQKNCFNAETIMKAEDFYIYSVKKAFITAVPSNSNRLGSDFFSGIIATGVLHSDRRLFIYIGTETKAVLNLSGKLFVSGLSDCEVYECVGLEFGMRTETGAVESVKIEDDIKLSVIGESLPRGICGSGLMELAWQLKKQGAVDGTGHFVGSADIIRRCCSMQCGFVSNNMSKSFVLYKPQSEFESHVSVAEEEMVAFFRVLSKTAEMIERLFVNTGMSWDSISTVVVGGPFARTIDRGVFSGLSIMPYGVEKRFSFIQSPAVNGLQRIVLNRDIFNEVEKKQDNIVYL